jgi:hypothetical protein
MLFKRDCREALMTDRERWFRSLPLGELKSDLKFLQTIRKPNDKQLEGIRIIEKILLELHTN